MLCACSGEQFRFEDQPGSPESLATRDFSASGLSSSRTRGGAADWDSKLEDSQVDEAESTLKEALSLNYEEARALLGRLEYQRGNFDAALQVFKGIDIKILTPRITKAIVERTRPCKPPRSKSSVTTQPPPTSMSMHSVSLLLEAILLKIASSIRVIPDFPKPGIMFQDITTLLLDTEAFKDTIDIFVERYKGKGISVVAGVEARGFIFGPPIALAIGAKFVPMRKPKKLPGKVISEEYSLEYGTDKIEMHVGAVEPGERAIIIDDLIATGGTLAAAIRLLERVGVKIVECACVIELPELKGREKLGEAPLFILVTSDAA